MVFNILFIILIFIWLGGLSFLVLKSLANYNQLTRGATSQTLSEVLSELLKNEQRTQVELKDTLVKIKEIEKTSETFIQKIGLTRFNPFADTGGDQSFSLALLNGKLDGIIMTSLYARSGVRWYIKTIRKGKGVEHDLSKEEQEALKKALHA